MGLWSLCHSVRVFVADMTSCTVAYVRYKAAHDVLFGNQLDLASRFDMSDDSEKGTILLNKIFQTYQDIRCIRHA